LFAEGEFDFSQDKNFLVRTKAYVSVSKANTKNEKGIDHHQVLFNDLYSISSFSGYK
jgi:hypothetical protein